MRYRPVPFPTAAISIRVRCEGRLHTLTRHPDGAVELRDHASIPAEEVAAVLREAPCRCLFLLHAWRYACADRYAPVGDVPRAWRPALWAVRQQSLRRRWSQRRQVWLWIRDLDAVIRHHQYWVP